MPFRLFPVSQREEKVPKFAVSFLFIFVKCFSCVIFPLV